MDQAGYVQKRGWNDFFKYKYVTEGDLVATIRPLMAKAGIIIIPNVVEERREPDAVQERNGMAALTTVMIQYTITDGKASIDFRMPGYGVDRSDKGVYKAITGSMKYALMKLFLVETGDDPERDAEATEEGTVTITPSEEPGIERGGKAKNTTRYQLQRITATLREKQIDREQFLSIIRDTLGVEFALPEQPEQASTMLLQFLRELESDEAGQLLKVLDAWQVPDADA